jgi:hypothetical protein
VITINKCNACLELLAGVFPIPIIKRLYNVASFQIGS